MLNPANAVLGKLSAVSQANLFLRTFGITKIPMLAFVGPKIMSVNEQSVIVRIPFNWRTKNHLGSMYFGVLAAGADTAGAFMAMDAIWRSGRKIDLVFKDFKATFLRRATGDVDFRCTVGDQIGGLVQEAIATGDRHEMTVPVTAVVPSQDPEQLVATFELTLSIKRRN